jgi:hypothetical protein
MLIGRQIAPGTSTPGSECLPEKAALRGLYSGESAVVGGDDLLGGSPPAERPLTGGKRLGWTYLSYSSFVLYNEEWSFETVIHMIVNNTTKQNREASP